MTSSVTMSSFIPCLLRLQDYTVFNERPKCGGNDARAARMVCFCPMNSRMLRLLLSAAALILTAALTFAAAQQKGKAEAPKSVRLYILDCGKITGVGEAAFGFQPGQL